MTKIGKNIKKIRGVNRLSQQAFAELFGLTRGNISSYEEFRAEPKIESVVKIANYFGIPVSDFISKELSVNELLHYDSAMVTEADKIKKANKFVQIPFVASSYIEEYIANYNNSDYIELLPQLSIPSNAKFQLLAIEIDNPENLPVGFSHKNGDIAIFEQVKKENIHRIAGRLGIMVNNDGIKTGIYTQKDSTIQLVLNELVSYPFNLDSGAQYWVIRAMFSQVE